MEGEFKVSVGRGSRMYDVIWRCERGVRDRVK